MACKVIQRWRKELKQQEGSHEVKIGEHSVVWSLKKLDSKNWTLQSDVWGTVDIKIVTVKNQGKYIKIGYHQHFARNLYNKYNELRTILNGNGRNDTVRRNPDWPVNVYGVNAPTKVYGERHIMPLEGQDELYLRKSEVTFRYLFLKTDKVSAPKIRNKKK